MRVLMVAEHLPPNIGGVERHIAGLTSELLEKGVELTLVAPTSKPQQPPLENQNMVRIMRIPRSSFGSRDYISAWNWWIAQRSLLNDIDLIHFHGVYAMLRWSGPALLMARSKPRFLTFHGYEMRYPIYLRAFGEQNCAGIYQCWPLPG